MQTGAAPTHRQVCATLGSRGSVGPQVVQHAVHHWRPGPMVGCQPPSMFRSGGCASARRRGAAAAAAAGMAGMACPGACPCLRPASPRGFEGQRRPASGERRHTSRATQLPVTDLRTDCKGDRLRTAHRLQRRRSRRQPFDPPTAAARCCRPALAMAGAAATHVHACCPVYTGTRLACICK